MNAPITLSPDALAAISRPAGTAAFEITSREQWLDLRKPLVTASVAAAMFGAVHPYQTAYGLWALKSGLIEEDPTENPAMRRGRLLEPVALQLLAEDYPSWTIAPCRKFYADPVARMGATPDAFATRPDIPGFGVVQIKTVGHFAFKKGWRGMDGDVEVPLWIAVQASVEAALTGASWACVAAMSLGDGGLELHVEDVPVHRPLLGKISKLVADFWRRVEENDPPSPDYARDGAAIAAMFSEVDGSEIDLSGNNRVAELIAAREPLKAAESSGAAAKKERDKIDAELRFSLGNATRGRLADGRILEAKVTRNAGYTVEPFEFRAIRLKEPKAQKQRKFA